MSDLTSIASDERDVWAAVYAAEWVTGYRRCMDIGGADFDRATKQIDHAERAITIANRAVLQLRRWREQEDKSAGHVIDEAIE